MLYNKLFSFVYNRYLYKNYLYTYIFKLKQFYFNFLRQRQ